jgi:hypothetical protein
MQSGATRVVIVVTPYESALRASYPRVVNCLNSTLTGLKMQVKESRLCPPTRNPTATPCSGTPVSQVRLIAVSEGCRLPEPSTVAKSGMNARRTTGFAKCGIYPSMPLLPKQVRHRFIQRWQGNGRPSAAHRGENRKEIVAASFARNGAQDRPGQSAVAQSA